jgi:hypothetical protein
MWNARGRYHPASREPKLHMSGVACNTSVQVTLDASDPLHPTNSSALPVGPTVWSFDTDHDVKSSPAIGFDGRIYVGSDSGKLYAFGGEVLGVHHDQRSEERESGCACRTRGRGPSVPRLA